MLDYEEIRTTWKERVEAYRTSEKTQKEWCIEMGIKQNTLKKWICKLNKEKEIANGPKWLELNIGDKGVAHLHTPEISSSKTQIKINGLELEINNEIEEKLLIKLMKALTQIC